MLRTDNHRYILAKSASRRFDIYNTSTMKRLKRLILDVPDDGFSYGINRDGPLKWLVLSMFCLDLVFFDLVTNKS